MGKDRRLRPVLAADAAPDEARYRATFHRAAIGIAHTTPDGAVLDVNPAFAAIVGYTAAELLRMRLPADLAFQESALVGSSSSEAAIERLLSAELDSCSCTEQYRHRDGSLLWVQRTVSAVFENTARPYLVHLIEDVTSRKQAEEQQRLTDLRYRRTLESALDCIISTDHLGRIIEFNPMAERIFGYRRQDVLGRKLAHVLVPPQLRKRHEASMARLLSGGQESMLNRRIETIALKADGSVIPVELMMQRITDIDPPLFTGFLRDISARKAAEARILRLNRLYRTLSQTSALIVRARERDTLFRGICQIARQHGGFLMPWVGLVDSDSGAVTIQAHAGDEPFEAPRLSTRADVPEGLGPVGIAVREARVVVCNHSLHDPDNALWRERHQRYGIRALAVLPLVSGGKVSAVLMLKSSVAGYFDEDIQQLLREMADELSHALERLRLEERHRDAERRLSHLAHYDQLTSLPNRGLFYERLTHSIAHAKRNGWTVCVMFIDLDRFKKVNDTMGHTIGDGLLYQLAARLLECVRAEDTVSRLSGDEFAIVLSQLADTSDAGIVACKILDHLRQPYRIEGVELVVSASVGLSLYPHDGDTAEALMRNADVAMHTAKARGDSYQFYTAEMNERALAKLQLESRLRGALDRDEFILHYQPQVAIETGRICAFEALLRWQPAGEPLVLPGEFIPLLEETGLITPVGEWVLRAACAQIAAWQQAGCEPVPIAINLSARQLRHSGFREAVGRALAHHAVAPRLIEIEITESSLMENPEEAQSALRDLKSLGVTLAIDDFGTGYSSLAYLKRFPFDTLKIDGSFVRDIGSDPDDATIARTIIALASSLSLTVVAEGVESEEQLEFLAAYGCDQAQGFLFSRPLPADSATDLLSAGVLLHGPARRGSRVRPPAVLVFGSEGGRLLAIQQLLQRDDYPVLTASGLEDALDMLREHDVAVVIADGNSGAPSALEFLRRVRAVEPQVVRMMLGKATDSRSLREALSDGTVERFFASEGDDELLREEVRKAVSRSYPALARATGVA